jgi:erythromycin esterase
MHDAHPYRVKKQLKRVHRLYDPIPGTIPKIGNADGSRPVTLTDAAVRPLATLDPDAPLDDLTWLDDVVGDARVVAIGESAHYNGEFYELRHRVLRYLVERHGFSAYTTESGFPEGWLVDRWVRGGDGPLGEVEAVGMTSLMGLWTQLAAMLTWLRGRNETAVRPVGFYGIDLGGSNASLLPGLDATLAYLAAADPDYTVDPAIRETAATWAAPHAFGIPQAVGAYFGLTQPQKDALTAGLARLAVRMSAQRLEYVERTSLESYDRVQRSLTLATTIDAVAGAMARGDNSAVMSMRDVAMADTVEWVLRREGRIVLAAHNGHIQRFPISFRGMAAAPTLGVRLADLLGGDYVAIGTTSGTGQTLTSDREAFAAGEVFTELSAPRAGSLDALMQSSHDGPFAVDLRRLGPADFETVRAVDNQRFADEYPAIRPLEAYDAVVHIPHVTAADFDPAAFPYLPEDLQKMFT